MSAPFFLPFPFYGSRPEYLKATGHEAPPFDPSLPPKFWADLGVNPNANKLYTYKTVVRGNNGYFNYDHFSLPPAQALAVNLPGHATFPMYMPPPTGVTVTSGPAVIQSTLIDRYLSTQSVAEDYAAELGGRVTLVPFDAGDTVMGLGQYQAYCITDVPNVKQLYIKGWAPSNGLTGVLLMAGFLACAKNYYGVGAPGHWETNANSQTIEWVNDTPDGPDSNGLVAIPRPVRDPGPDEILSTTPWGATFAPKVNPNSPPPDPSGATLGSLAAMLTEVLALLKAK